MNCRILYILIVILMISILSVHSLMCYHCTVEPNRVNNICFNGDISQMPKVNCTENQLCITAQGQIKGQNVLARVCGEPHMCSGKHITEEIVNFKCYTCNSDFCNKKEYVNNV